jgi:type IV secretory pathway VirB10-like protein
MTGPATLVPSAQPGVRRLNSRAAWLMGGVGAVAATAVAYTIATSGSRAQLEQATPPMQFPSSADDVLAKAPLGDLTPYPPPPPPPAPAPAPLAEAPPPTVPAPVDPDMTEMAIEARRKAWQSYYAQLAERDERQRKGLLDALSGAASVTEGWSSPPLQQAQQGGGPMAGGIPSLPGEPQTVAQHQLSFLSGQGASPDTDYSPYTVTAPISAYELKAGDVINGRMISGLNSDGPGTIKAVVSQNVYDHATGMHILIPQGSTLVGVYDDAVAYGQNRVVVGWQRITYPAPGSESLDLGRMPGSDQEGYAGFQDETDNHYFQIFTNAILLSLFSAGTQLSQPQASNGENYSPGQTVASSMGQQLGQLGQEFARRGLDIPPTNRIRNGYPFSIMITRDIAFPRPWTPSAVPGQSNMAVHYGQQ